MKNFKIAILMTIVTTVLLGLVYPLVVTGIAQLIFPDQANGQLIKRADGTIIGSKLIGQPFNSAGYFHSRPSAASSTGTAFGYDAAYSYGSNYGPTNQEADRSRGRRRAETAGGQSWEACARGSGHRLRLRIGSAHLACRC